MHSMYEQFYRFLANSIVKYFKQIDLKPGAKYDIRLPNMSEVEDFYNIFALLEESEPFNYQVEGQSAYNAYALKIGEIKIILASTALSVTEDFLALLRNKVGTDDVLFKNTAILFIHHGSLESILKGADSLQKIGMPLHPDMIRQVVEDRLKDGDYSLTIKRVLRFVMNKKEVQAIDNRNALVEYREILEILNQEKIDTKQYSELGLFFDSSLENVSEGEARERLKENAKIYGLISNYHQNNNVRDSVLEKYFSKNNMKLINTTKWNTLDYTKLDEDIKANKAKQPIEYLPEEDKHTEEGLTYWETTEKDTATGRRTINFIIFNPDYLPQINLRLKFDSALSKNNCQVAKGSQLDFFTNGKQLTLILQGVRNEITYGRIKYKHIKDYNFKVLVVPVGEEVLKELKVCYKLPTKIADKGIYIEPIDEVIRMNTKALDQEYIELIEQGQQVEFKLDKQLIITNSVQDESSNLTVFVLKYEGIHIPLYIKSEAIKPKMITSVKINKLKRENRKDFTYFYNEIENSLKLYQETAQYYLVDDALERMKFEIELVKDEKHYYKVQEDGLLIGETLELSEGIERAYKQLVTYYQAHQTLPSLAALNKELIAYMEDYVKVYVETVENIARGEILNNKEQNLHKLGSIYNRNKEEILWTPLHPINIMYELQRNQELRRDEVDEQILKKIKPLGLVPYIKDDTGNLYESKELNDLTWLKFVASTSKVVCGKYELAKIVEKSIISFRSNFAYLFDMGAKLPLKINLVGNDETEILLGGLLRVIAHELKKTEPDQLKPIEIRIYEGSNQRSIFHELEYDNFNAQHLIEAFDVNYDTAEYTLNQFMKIFRSKVSIYILEESLHTECHICFVGLNGKSEVSHRNSQEVAAGIYLNGMINAPTIYLENGSYVKTVGLKGLEESLLTKTVRATNALAYIGMSSTPFNPHAAIATVINNSHIITNEGHEQKATWIVYLEPKVSYSYFSEKEDVLVHYVDCLYAPNMIDAVTLTYNINYYKSAIQNKVETLGFSKEVEDLNGVMKLSNILNGEWLLELLSNKKLITLESINNPLLVRWSTQLLNKEDFLWVPVSLHDFMRTCESVGIRSSKGLLKNKNYERFINDILWIGYKFKEGEVCFYPISLRKTDKEAGIFKELSENIYDDSFEGKYFRQLLLERGLFNLKELIHAELFQNDEAEQLVIGEVEDRLLQGKYEVVEVNEELLGKEAIIVFSEEKIARITKGKTGLTININQKKLWQDELNLPEQVIEMVDLGVEHVLNNDLQNMISANISNVVNEQADVLEDLFYVPRYSIVYYFEEIPKNIKDIMYFYTQKGVKLYLVLNQGIQDLRDQLGKETLLYFEELISKQVLSITYDAQIELDETDEVYIADGEIINKEFYRQLKRTSFNLEQYIIEHAPMDENLSVKAGAGTGKTKVMIDRIMYLKHIEPTLSLSEITMITFTNESMMEMRSRLAKRLRAYYEMSREQRYLKWMDELNNMRISTIHAFSLDVLQMLGDEIGIVDMEISSYKHRKDRLIEEGIHTYKETYPKEYMMIRLIEQYKIKNAIKEMSNFLDNRAIIVEENWKQLDFGTSNSSYHGIFEYVLKYVGSRLQKEKKESCSYEINDLIKMLRDVTKVQSVQSKLRIKYLMIDEFQDTDEVQIEFVGWLIKQIGATLFIVGDIKQSIYRFRGAEYTAFSQIEESLGEKIKIKHITKNYRTDTTLLKMFNNFFYKISMDIENFGFDEKSYLQGVKEGSHEEPFEIKRLRDTDSIFAKVKEIYLSHKGQGTICVLTRTNEQVREVVQRLEEMKIPSVTETKGDFYRQQAVRDFYALIRAFIYTERLQEWMLLEESVYGDNKLSYKDVIKSYRSDGEFLKELLEDYPWFNRFQKYALDAQASKPLQVIRHIIEETKPHLKYARKYYHEMLGDTLSQKEVLEVAKYQAYEYEANLNQLLYILQKQFSDQAMTLSAIEEFLKYKILTDTTEDQITYNGEEIGCAIKVMTVHKAKGLEFEIVIVPFTDSKFENHYTNQFILSKEAGKYHLAYDITLDSKHYHKVSNNYYEDLHNKESQEIIGEETRLLYVACTRAKHKFYAFINAFANDNGRINSWQDLLVKR